MAQAADEPILRFCLQVIRIAFESLVSICAVSGHPNPGAARGSGEQDGADLSVTTHLSSTLTACVSVMFAQLWDALQGALSSFLTTVAPCRAPTLEEINRNMSWEGDRPETLKAFPTMSYTLGSTG